ncbi:Hypothetical predicted protein [Pelobates cultripes]|uniref:Uncharacterized protein n=1 Tax=Pelobates cultripes TaxID=61616 RepID=A0AAD1R9T6_PELCU|nr:Hypothetical predicted protein [Pelobates cultripes]
MLEDFRSHGYKDTSLQEALAKAKNRERTSLLRTKGKNKRNKSNRIPCVTTYSTKSGLVKHVINKNWHVLQSDPEIADLFKGRPLMAYKRLRNIKSLVSPSRARISSKPSTTWLAPIKDSLKHVELLWIYRLDTLFPHIIPTWVE